MKVTVEKVTNGFLLEWAKPFEPQVNYSQTINARPASAGKEIFKDMRPLVKRIQSLME